MIIGCRILSSFLACGISIILGFGVGTYSAFFRLVWERGVLFPSPINPVFGVFAGGLEGSFFAGSTRVFPAGVFSSDSIVAISNWISDRAPPASSSLAFRFSRLTCDLEYGRRDASTSCEKIKFRNSDPDDADLLSSNLARLSILFPFFGVTDVGPPFVEDNASRTSVTYGGLVSLAHDRCMVGLELCVPSSPSRCLSRHALPDFPGLRTVALPQTEQHDRGPWFGNELPLAMFPI